MKAQDHYRALVESSDDAIIAKDLDSIVVSWNPAAERLFGFTADEMVGQSIRRLIPESRQREEDDILAKIVNGERISEFTTERLRKDGSRVRVFVTVSPVLDDTGTVIGASKIARDATVYLNAQDKIEASELLFRTLADNISQIAWVTDPQGKVAWCNRRLEEYTGLPSDALEQGGRASIHHPEHMARVLARYNNSMETGEEWEEIFPLKGIDGNYRWFLARAHPIRDRNGAISHWCGTHTDIHDQREQADRVRLLLNEVNHRTKNLLATVQALARRTANAGDGDDSFVERFEARMEGLATNQDLLVKGEWLEVDLEELIRRQLGFLGATHGQLEIWGPPCSVEAGAAEAIGMATHELATNSLKYGALSVGEGRIEIGWDVDRPNKWLHLWWREKDGPPVSAPTHKGFGTTLIADLSRAKLKAEVELDFAPDGLRWSVKGEGLLAGDDSHPGPE